MKSIFYLISGLTGLLIFISCGQSPSSSDTLSMAASPALKGQSAVAEDPNAPKNILQVAIGSPDHTTLVAGVQAASLEDVLVNAGPLTVFAPTNEAFAKLPPGTLDELLKPENKAKLARIIKFHASPGTFRIKDLRDGMQLYQATGHYIKVKNQDGQVRINGANILGTVEASNGVVHVIDAVMLPPDF